MQRALKLAARGKGRTSPNPMVGAVIVRGDKIIAEGYHKKAGTPHAEIIALKKAGPKARGATLCVNLEPCCHTEKKTPPCTRAIIKSGIKKAVIAMKDPNPKVSGKGIRELNRAGIKTQTGIMKAEAEKLNEAFSKFITMKQPFVILKTAQSLDGKIATSKGESKWITGRESRQLVHKIRNEVDAVLVGINTVKKDDPSLTCRIKGGRNPYRVIVDSRLNISPDAKALRHKDGKTIIAATDKALNKKIRLIEKTGNRVIVIKGKSRRVDLRKLMKTLAKQDIGSVMIEGGSGVNASALSGGIVDKIIFFVSPKIIGGRDAVPSIGGKSPALLNRAFGIKNINIKTVGKDILIEGCVSYKN